MQAGPGSRSCALRPAVSRATSKSLSPGRSLPHAGWGAAGLHPCPTAWMSGVTEDVTISPLLMSDGREEELQGHRKPLASASP